MSREARSSLKAQSSQLTAEVLRINLRYLTEVVEAFGLCPFARQVRLGGGLERRVSFDRAGDAAAAHALVTELGADSRVELGLLIYPMLALDPDAFDRLVQRLRQANADRGGERPVFAMAPFHPRAAFSAASPERLVGLFRRAPDPTIQLVRLAALDALRQDGASGELSRRITADNHARFVSEGLERFQAVYDDIEADRARSYAKFAADSWLAQG